MTVARVTLTSEKMFNCRKLRRPNEVKTCARNPIKKHDMITVLNVKSPIALASLPDKNLPNKRLALVIEVTLW